MEWKFARSKLWMGYFDEGSTLPPPFNLIVSPKSVYYLVTWIKRVVEECFCQSQTIYKQRHWRSARGSKRSGKTVRPSEANIFKTTHSRDVFCSVHDGSRTAYNGRENIPDERPQEKYNNSQRYQEVMRRLICRYIHQAKKQSRQGGVCEDDVLEIKQDISSLRFELREDRKKEVARTTCHVDSLRRDLQQTITRLSPVLSPTSVNGLSPNHGLLQTTFCGKTLPGSRNLLTPSRDARSSLNAPHEGDVPKSVVLSSLDLDYLKAEVVAGVREELREVLKQTVLSSDVTQHRQPQSSPQQLLLPPLAVQESDSVSLHPYSSELYHTHLYTQL